jgi:hypothetical protein
VSIKNPLISAVMRNIIRLSALAVKKRAENYSKFGKKPIAIYRLAD